LGESIRHESEPQDAKSIGSIHHRPHGSPAVRKVIGHANADHYLTCADTGSDGPYKNSISLDQVLAAHSTRVATYMMGRENTGGPQDLLARAVGLNNAHGLTRDVKKPNGWRNLGTYNRFQAEEFGRLIQKLKDTREPNGNGTLLDNIFAMHGSASSSFHLSRNYPIISAGGKNLGFQNGRYLKFGTGNEDNQAYAGIAEDTVWQKDPDHHELPLAHLFVTILKRMGIETNEFASYTGALERI